MSSIGPFVIRVVSAIETMGASELAAPVEGLVVSTANCADAKLSEDWDTYCQGQGWLVCHNLSLQSLEEPLFGVETQSPVDILIYDSQGNVMETDAQGLTKNGLSSPGWIFKGPGDKKLALIFDAEDKYVVAIVGRPEAGTGSTFDLQLMRQASDGSQTIFTYTNVPTSSQGTATTIVSEGITPVLEVDIDGDGTNDAHFLPTEAMESQLWIFPTIINRHRGVPEIMALLRLSEGITKDQIDSEQPLLLYPGGIEATCQRAIQWRSRGGPRTSIFAFFNKAALMGAVPDDGSVELKVVGKLNTGQYFYGSDTVRIVSWRWWRPWWDYDNYD